MPFGFPWTDAPAGRDGPQRHPFLLSERAAFTQDNWRMNFLIRLDAR